MALHQNEQASKADFPLKLHTSKYDRLFLSNSRVTYN